MTIVRHFGHAEGVGGLAQLVGHQLEDLLGRPDDPDLAEDAVQEALLSAHRALAAGTVPADVRAWL